MSGDASDLLVLSASVGERGATLALTGELDLASASRVTREIERLVSEHRAINIDLRELQFMDSTGIATLVRAFRRAQTMGWELSIDPRLTPQVSRVIALTGVDVLFWPDRPKG
jgi:stage II sporulation protein AA (anti-sigma F factor antagonist)